MKLSLIASGALLVSACASSHPPDVPPGPAIPDGDGLGSPIGLMCVRLRALGCPEGRTRALNGKQRTCYQAMSVVQDTATIPVECVTLAPNVEAVRSCGDSARTITFRCATGAR
jgi:hypothetical protein